MALKALTCPQCGANLELDDEREFGFCQFCGAKVQINEVIEVRHSFDYTEHAENSKALADRAYDAKNYEEAYVYYSKVLEDTPSDITSLYRRAITKVFNTCLKEVNLAEFRNEMDVAVKNINELPGELDKDAFIKAADEELSELLLFCIGHLGSHPTSFESLDGCLKQEKEWKKLIEISKEICKYSQSEKAKEWILENIVQFCDEQFEPTLKYKEYYKGEDGKIKSDTRNYKVNDELLDFVKEARKSFAEEYNNLPTKAQITKELNEQMEAKIAEIEDLENQIKDLKKNKFPEKLPVTNEVEKVTDLQTRKKLLKNGKKPIANSFNWIMTAVFLAPAVLDALVFGVMKLIALIGSAITKKEMESMLKPTKVTLILLIALAAAGVIAIVIFWIIRVKKQKTTAKIVAVDGQQKYITYIDNEEYLQNEAAIKERKKLLSEKEKERSKIKGKINDHEKTLL